MATRTVEGRAHAAAKGGVAQADPAARLRTPAGFGRPAWQQVGAALSGSRKGQHSIRINDQYRVCFVWEDGDAYDVEVTDYH